MEKRAVRVNRIDSGKFNLVAVVGGEEMAIMLEHEPWPTVYGSAEEAEMAAKDICAKLPERTYFDGMSQGKAA